MAVRSPRNPVVLLVSFASVSFAQQGEAPFAVLVKLGLSASQQERWDGRVQVAGGTLRSVAGWVFGKGDAVGESGSWNARTRQALGRTLQAPK